MNLPVHYIAQYFDKSVNLSDVHYFTLDARPARAGMVGQDSSDQEVFIFDQYSGITAYRSGLVWVNHNNMSICAR